MPPDRSQVPPRWPGYCLDATVISCAQRSNAAFWPGITLKVTATVIGSSARLDVGLADSVPESDPVILFVSIIRRGASGSLFPGATRSSSASRDHSAAGDRSSRADVKFRGLDDVNTSRQKKIAVRSFPRRLIPYFSHTHGFASRGRSRVIRNPST